jgi:hypothetical protein
MIILSGNLDCGKNAKKKNPLERRGRPFSQAGPLTGGNSLLLLYDNYIGIQIYIYLTIETL